MDDEEGERGIWWDSNIRHSYVPLNFGSVRSIYPRINNPSLKGLSIKDVRPKSDSLDSPPVQYFRLEDFPPPPIQGCPDHITHKRLRKYFAIGHSWTGRVSVGYWLRNAKDCVCGRPVDGRPPPVRGRPHCFTPPCWPDVFDGWPLTLYSLIINIYIITVCIYLLYSHKYI